MDERAQEKLHKESLKGIVDSITLNAEKMLFDDRETRWNGKSLRDVNRRSCTQVQNPKSWNDTEKRRFRPLDSEF